ncbi:MAG: histone deacetylase [Silvanigrellaceae bacterium]
MSFHNLKNLPVENRFESFNQEIKLQLNGKQILDDLSNRKRQAFKVWSCEDFPLELPEGHPFPNKKYPLLEAFMLEQGFAEHVTRCGKVERHFLEAVHSPAYVQRVMSLNLTPEESRRVGFPTGHSYLNRALASVEGTLCATRHVLQTGALISGVLAGGTHHAFSDRGEGYCTFNDIAVASRHALNHSVDRVLVIDLDAHQGNGTAAIFSREPRVFTFSMHAEENYPRSKERSSLDIGLPLGTKDEQYLEILIEHIPVILDGFKPQLVFFQSGVDVLSNDRFGRLGLTAHGQYLRDKSVFEHCLERNIPCVITIGGGYQHDHAAVAMAHAQTFLTAAECLARHSCQT